MNDWASQSRESSAVVIENDIAWFVLHTRSRQEKVVASQIHAMGARHYLPLVKQVNYYGKRKTNVHIPLFPGYVFLYGSAEQAYTLDRAKRLANILKVSDQKRLEWELENLQLAIERNADFFPHPYLHEGVKVEVRAGPFRGIQGIVERKKKNNRLLLQVHSFGGAVSLEVDSSLLTPLEQAVV